ncbi:MAG: DUF2971 domain-containing protein [Planctomycetes bacterium]|nr:DUF2971 domain-containing protein [Planctomycetota bacterium]
MNVLYKYCDQLGIVKILGSLELKLPYISEVNDPLECMPFLDEGNITAMKEQCIRRFKSKGKIPSPNWEQILEKKWQTGEVSNLRKELIKCIDEMKQKSCLVSVSQEAGTSVMWAHYSEKHRGGVIGIDFEHIFPNMELVRYSEQRPNLCIWDDFYSIEFQKKYFNTLITKSSGWVYEKEFRNILDNTDLMDLEKNGLAFLKDFNGKKTWFLRLNPESIREVVFGLYTEESLKLAIRKLIERPELQHVKLYQTGESKTYTLNLVDIENR